MFALFSSAFALIFVPKLIRFDWPVWESRWIATLADGIIK
jgi:hypothetical protein